MAAHAAAGPRSDDSKSSVRLPAVGFLGAARACGANIGHAHPIVRRGKIDFGHVRSHQHDTSTAGYAEVLLPRRIGYSLWVKTYTLIFDLDHHPRPGDTILQPHGLARIIPVPVLQRVGQRFGHMARRTAKRLDRP